MATIEELKARLQGLNRTSQKSNDIWKPKDEHTIRLLPYPYSDDPFITLYFHYDVGDNPPILCPKTNFGNECDVCDFCDVLRAWKGPSGADKPEKERKSDFEIFKKMQSKAQIFSPMIERGKEAEGPKFVRLTPNQSLEILERVCLDADRQVECGIDLSEKDTKKLLQIITNTDKAYDLVVTHAKPGEKGNTKMWPVTTYTGKIKATSLLQNKKDVNDLLAKVKHIKDVYPELSSSEVSKMLKKFVGSSSPEAKPEGGTEKYASNTRENSKSVGARTIDEAFGDMLADNTP